MEGEGVGVVAEENSGGSIPSSGPAVNAAGHFWVFAHYFADEVHSFADGLLVIFFAVESLDYYWVSGGF